MSKNPTKKPLFLSCHKAQWLALLSEDLSAQRINMTVSGRPGGLGELSEDERNPEEGRREISRETKWTSRKRRR